RRLVADPAGRMLVHDAAEAREIEALAGADHRRGQRRRLLCVHAAPDHGHAERGHLVVGNIALRVTLHERVDLVGGELPAVALPLDELDDAHQMRAITPLITSARRLPARFATSSTASCVTCSIWPGMPVAMSVTVLIARISMPMCRATRTSGTVLIPTASAPKPRSMRSSAGVSKLGPATATSTPSRRSRSTLCATSRSASVYVPTMSGKRGPRLSSFGPRSGFVPMKLMWSLRTMRSPFLKAGFKPPHAFVMISVRTPQARRTRTGKPIAAMS